MKITELKKYLPFLLQASCSEIKCGEWGGGKSENGAMSFPYITYKKWVTDLIHDCDCIGCFPKDLYGVVKQIQSQFNNFNNAVNEIENINYIKAIIGYIIRRDRFCEGLLEESIKSGFMYKAVKKLIEVEAKHDSGNS